MFFMSFFVASFYAFQVLSNPRICRSFVAYFHVTQWMVLAKLFQIVGPIFVPRILQLLGLTFYSLISIRQNYKFDILAMFWHEIVCWFLKICQDLKRFAAQEHRIVFVMMCDGIAWFVGWCPQGQLYLEFKGFDEFRSLLIFAGQIWSRFPSKVRSFHKSR